VKLGELSDVERGELFALEAGRAQEAVDSLRRCVNARAFALLARVRLRGRQAFDDEREAARRREGARTLVDQPGIDQPVGDHFFQVLRRLRLHAGGDFLGEQFKQEIRHDFQSSI